MHLTQVQLAKQLGIHRSVISKLLNDPKSIRLSKKTRAAVYKLVKKSGYLEKFYQTKHHRSNERKKVKIQNIPVQIILKNGQKYSSGTVSIANISKSGALLSNLSVESIPNKPFKFVFQDAYGKNLYGKLKRVEMNGSVEYGVEFIQNKGNLATIKSFLVSLNKYD